ncbi:MAG TPA: zf-HC2 domain-containing protein [Thermoanaerobaculia bacterium]
MSDNLGAWLRESYENAGCPPPEAFLEEEMAALSPADRRRLEEHADRCPACAAERDLARAFDTGPAGLPAADVEFVVSKLEKAGGDAAGPRGRVVKFPSRAPAVPAPRRTSAPSWWRMAAVLFVVLGAALLFQLTRPGGPPPLPAPESGGVFRGGEVEVVAPVGEIAVIPDELIWVRTEGARSYRVRLLAVDDTVLWETKVPAPPARLPAEVFKSLHPAVAYTWTVEALGPAGERLAVSEPVRFRAKPTL